MKHIKPNGWLLIGIIFIVLTHMRFGISILAFLEPIPFLIYLDQRRAKSSILFIFLALLVGWTLATLKIVTDPIPWFIAPAYGLPIALFKTLGYLAYLSVRNHRWVGYLFPSAFVIAEWVQGSLTPLATWGSMAYTQVNNIVWTQIVSLGGMWLLTFVVYLIAYQLFLAISSTKKKWDPTLLVLTILLVSVFGSLRLTLEESQTREMVTIAAIGTDSRIGPIEFPSADSRSLNRTRIYERMSIARQAGAELVVWTEAAAGILPEEEASFQQEVRKVVDSLNIGAVVSYVVPVQFNPLQYENKYIAIDSSGVIQHGYLKHQPVPGEPAIKGVEPHASFNLSGLNLGGAICYDYDFPDLGRSIARLDVDIVALPSSDWRGIDPIHTQMAGFRAVEGGYSLVRSTRWGLSAAIDHHGRFTGWSSDNDSGAKVLLAELPRTGVKTIYSMFGDWLPALCLAVLLLAVTLRFRKRTTD